MIAKYLLAGSCIFVEGCSFRVRDDGIVYFVFVSSTYSFRNLILFYVECIGAHGNKIVRYCVQVRQQQ